MSNDAVGRDADSGSTEATVDPCRLRRHQNVITTRSIQRTTSILAVYVDLARRDEVNISDRRVSLASSIARIENDGIYQLLCELQMSAVDRRLNWDPTVARDVRLIGCAFEVQAPRDNRNYIVFYTLKKLLSALIRNY